MNFITWLFAGAVLGWLAPFVFRRRQSAQLLNIIVGMVGAFVAGYLFPPVFRVSTINQGSFSLPALMISLGGAVILLATVNFFLRENNVKTDVIERSWAQVRSKIPTRWDKLTEEDVDKIDGNHSRFVATLQARYRCDNKEAEDQIQRFFKSVLVNSGRSFANDRVQVVDDLPGAPNKT